MSDQPKNKVALVLREYAEKLAADKQAANGSPDRMTVADGQGGVSTHSGSVSQDSALSALTKDLPANAAGNQAYTPSTTGDSMTVADGQGGITTGQSGCVSPDPSEKALKKNLPADGETRKSAGERVQRIREAMLGKSAAPAAAQQPQQPRQYAQHTPAPEEFGPDTLAKIASAILSTDEGIQFTHSMLEKQAGEAAASEQIQQAIVAAETFDTVGHIKSAAFDDVVEKAANIHDGLVENGVTEEAADIMLKQAAVHQEYLGGYDHPMLKQAYAQGMDDEALLEAADEAAGQEGVPPVDEALEMGGEEGLGEEEILMLLQEMIESGEITEEDVMAALQEAGAMEEGVLPEGEAM